MRNWKTFCLAAMLAVALVAAAGCGGGKQAAQTEKYPTRAITVIVPYAAGGGTDVGARMLLPYVEKDLGVPLTVVNKAGGGGWVGWGELLSGDTSGYTIAYINTPTLQAGYLNPSTKRDKTLDDFDVIANHVLDYGAIVVRADDKRFTTIKDLVELAKKNDLTACATGVAGDDHVAMLKLNKAAGTKFVALQTKGWADGKAALLGGHADVVFANVGEVAVPHKEKEIKVLAVMAEKRSKFMPDVPTLDETGYKGIYSWSGRGLAAKKGIPKDKLDRLVAAFEKGITNPEHVKKMEDMGLEIKFMKGEEFRKFLKSDEDALKSVSDLLGWKKAQ
jgi:tripartite-type tricarboxylate transporter receptor subunit TctC